ncbi:Ribonuclease H-like superfamily [Sesbania bispinosa]|nr:Ribonuclease H-like superfamily [Sesbania bispinosa]
MPNSTILQATTSPYDSYIWKSICKAKDILKDGFSLRIGSGNSFLWYSVWSELGKICDLVDYVHISDSTLQVRDIWSNGLWSFNNLATPIPNNIKDVIQGIPIPKFCSDGFKFMVTYWWLWRWRNSFIFDVVPWSIEHVLRNINLWFEEFNLKLPGSPQNMVVPRSVRWQPPDAGYIKVNVDGSCIISSGFCGAGGLLRGCDGQWLASFSMNLGKVGVLATELYVIRQGLMICLDMGYSYIWCESDSMEVVRLCLLSVIPLHHHLAVVIADIHKLMC